MILFAGMAQVSLERFGPHPNLGRLVQPKDCHRVDRTHEKGYPWAADNDAFNGWDQEAADRYMKMLDRIEGIPGCRFVALPDVVGDARATADRFNQYWEPLMLRGFPIALVLQDGIEELGVPWDKIQAVFVGGTTEFKLGIVAAEIVAEAKVRGKWAHMGRVNSKGRVRYAASLGCDSFDGSGFSKWSKTHLMKGVAWAQGGRQMLLAAE